MCFVPTASGDADHYVVRFYRTFAALGCEPSHLSLFRRDRTAATGDPGEHLLAQDLVYVGGGIVNTAQVANSFIFVVVAASPAISVNDSRL